MYLIKELKKNKMKKILAFAGSNSSQSINKKLVEFAGLSIKDIELKVLDLNDFELPIYGADFENEKGIPKSAQELLNLILSSDGILLSLAEHNGNYTAAFKNLQDWLSRIDIKVWGDKPILLLAAAPGKMGGKSVLNIAKASFPYMGANVVADFSLPRFYENFNHEEGISNGALSADFETSLSTFKNHL